MAAKGRCPLESCHLLEKVDENFAWAKPRGRVRRRKGQPNGREWPRARARPPFGKGGRKLYLGEAPQAAAPLHCHSLCSRPRYRSKNT